MAMSIENAQREITEIMHSLISTGSTKQQRKLVSTRLQPFEMFYMLNCHYLCADSHVDLDFKFSWVIVAMIQLFTGKAKTKVKDAIIQSFQYPPPLSPQEPNGPLASLNLIHQTDISPEQLTICRISRFAVASIGSQGTPLNSYWKQRVWHVLIGASYGYVYFYEYLPQTNSPKERALKEHCFHHATMKLKLLVDSAPSNWSHQAQQ